MYKYTHHNGELNIKHVGQHVALKGWVAKRRNLGGLLFIDLRDKEGITQLVIKPESTVYQEASSIKPEYVIEVKGVVVERESKNPQLKTGEIEILVTALHIINSAEKGYSFSTRLPNYSIWYNKDTQEIELLENKTVQVEMHSNEGNLLLSTNPLDTSIEEVIPGKILLSKNGKLANALHRLRNLTRAEDFNRIRDELVVLGVSAEHIELFNPENTLYINAFDGFTSARAVIPDADITDIDNGQNIPYVDNVVFASGIVSIPQLTIRKIGVGLNESTPYPIKLPVTVRTVERDAFTNIVSNSQIKTVDITKVQFEVGSLSVELKTKNKIVKQHLI